MTMNQLDRARDNIIAHLPLSKILARYDCDTRYERIHCPFHSDNTPSLFWSDEKQVFHCFGCGIKGTVVEFVKYMEEQQGNPQSQKHVIQNLANTYQIDIPDLDYTGISKGKAKRADDVKVSKKLRIGKEIQRIEQKLPQESVEVQLLGYYLVDYYHWGIYSAEDVVEGLNELLETGDI